MKAFVITAAAALALGLGTGAAFAAQPIGKPALRTQVPDGLVQNEGDRGRRWMRTWRDDQEQGERNQAPDRRRDEQGNRGKPAGSSDDFVPTERSGRGDEDNRGNVRPSKPLD